MFSHICDEDISFVLDVRQICQHEVRFLAQSCMGTCPWSSVLEYPVVLKYMVLLSIKVIDAEKSFYDLTF